MKKIICFVIAVTAAFAIDLEMKGKAKVNSMVQAKTALKQLTKSVED